MREIFVLVEHRQRQIREITFEMLTKCREIAENTDKDLIAVLLIDKDNNEYAKILSEYAEKVLLIEDVKLKNFNSEVYKRVLCQIIEEHKPLLFMIGHTSYGVDLAPSLATALRLPLATDCIDLEFEDESLVVTRQMYGGKVNVNATVRKSESYIVTLRQAVLTARKPDVNGEIIKLPSPLTKEISEKRFLGYVLPSLGEVDITATDVLVGVGRGIKDVKNIPIVKALAEGLGGVLACSRPVVDKGWLPNNRQVGSSGKTVKPKLYIAIGISGAFQHVLGMKNSELIIAINKDRNAPIFNFADYGIVDDLFKIVPALTNKINELE